jgi:PEP-CTERM motif
MFAMKRLLSLVSRWVVPAVALAALLGSGSAGTAAPLPGGFTSDNCAFEGCIVRYWSAEEGGNGHYYGFVPAASDLTWTEANAIAQGSTLGGGSVGYLASVISIEEQFFILDNLLPTGASKNQIWTGGRQAAGAESPSAGWQWVRPASVVPELWDYTNWTPSEPNDEAGVADERYLAMWVRYFKNGRSQRGSWNDEDEAASAASAIIGMLFEWESPDFEVPEPGTGLLIGLGAAALVGLRRRARS